MDILGILYSIILFILWMIWSVISWFLGFLLVPLLVLLIIAALALRLAWKSPLLRPYLEAWFARQGKKGVGWLKRILYSITVLPIHVLLRLMWLVPLHALINLLWRPKWDPLERAKKIPERKKKKKYQ